MLSARSSIGLIPVRLQPGDDVHASLARACEEHGATAAFVVSGIGMLSGPELGYLTGPGEYDRKRFDGDYELLNLSGNIARYGGELMCHLHVTLGGHDYAAFGGHLFEARAAVTVEVLLLPVGGVVRFERELDAASGLPALTIEASPS